MDTPYSQFMVRLCAVLDRAFTAWGESDPPLNPAAFNAMALALFRLHYHTVGSYRLVCDRSAATPDAVSHWSQLPAVPTAAFKEYDWTSLAPADRATVFYSSGTTESARSRQFHDAVSLGIYERAVRAGFRRHLLPVRGAGVDLAPRAALCLTPSPAEAPHSSLVHMLQSIVPPVPWARPLRFVGTVGAAGAWGVENEVLDRALADAVASGDPVLLAGPAFAFVHYLDHLTRDRRAWSLPAGSRVMETGGYKGQSRELPRSMFHALLTERLGVPSAWIVSEYGMCELSSQAYDHTVNGSEPPRRGIFQFPPWARAVVISVETGQEAAPGEVGLLRVVDLANVRSVLAVQTEDRARRVDPGFELLGRSPQAEPRGCSLLVADVGATQ